MRAQATCFKLDDEKKTKKLRGISKAAIKNVKFDTYHNCLNIRCTEEDKDIINTTIKTKNQTRYLQSTIEKVHADLMIKENKNAFENQLWS